ncbi:hypothetical protein DHW03_17825 [Pedobacter yonginense]|uniref:histidine kinase n=1 Tax=Pedobacter yonginense TaxID=651869 RepID=A0A317EJ01_9SPHI|nr:ATP-binding protein [Pedobacter yonginense]PWS26622.1 hypothetical protein DHW03_17825 [Pedobacter yonginense]
MSTLIHPILRILLLEDSDTDADLICRVLKKSGLLFDIRIVSNRERYEEALTDFLPQLILSDYALPAFDAVSAFRMKQTNFSHIPFIIISGIIGEENVVELIKEGVTDYVSKNSLPTLPSKISRAIREADEKREAEQHALDLAILSARLRKRKEELLNSNRLLQDEKEKVKAINAELHLLNAELEERVSTRTKSLEDSESQFRSMMETIPQIAWTNTHQGKMIFINRRWSDYTGFSEKQTGPKMINRLIHHEDLKTSFRLFGAILADGLGGEFQVRIRRGDGVYRWHLVRLMPIEKGSQANQIWIGTATDIQELRLLQQQKDDFISIASHELKTPITSLKLSLQLLDKIKESNSARIPALVNSANKSLEKVNVLIEDLLNAGMASEGQLHISKRKIPLAEIVCDGFKHLNTEGRYAVKLSGDLDIEIEADPVRIGQVITNFVDNAVKYAPLSFEIQVHIEKQAEKIKISVKDNGPGIRPENLRHLFDRYYRVDTSGSSYSGLGLGLFICGEIIRSHQGEIGVESQLGSGSTFWFTLPQQK